MTARTFPIPNFRAWRAVVLHRPSPAADGVLRQLERLGIEARQLWPELEAAPPAPDVVFFDADMGYDGQFPWPAGEPPVPLVALVGSEAPGRLEWVLGQGATAHLMKPVQSSGVYSALVVACHGFALRHALDREIGDLRGRLRRRPRVARALAGVMTAHGIDETEAMRRIRAAAMERRQTIEDYCDGLLAGRGARAAGREA